MNSKNYIDLGKGNAHVAGNVAVSPTQEVDATVADYMQKLPSVRISIDTSNGIKESIDAAIIPLFGQGLELMALLQDTRPTVYVHDKSKNLVQGMVSPNYDSEGKKRLPGIRILPIHAATFSIVKHKGLWTPNPDAVVPLAGATALESEGVGDHARSSAIDPEHRITAIGAVSIRNIDISRTHAQHGLRHAGGSLAQGLTNGKIGDVFASGSIDKFAGFGSPLVFDGRQKDKVAYIPLDFFQIPEAAFGGLVSSQGITPEQIMVGSAVGVLSERGVLDDLRKYESVMEERAQ